MRVDNPFVGASRELLQGLIQGANCFWWLRPGVSGSKDCRHSTFQGLGCKAQKSRLATGFKAQSFQETPKPKPEPPAELQFSFLL